MDNANDLRGLLYRSDAQSIDQKTNLPSDFTSIIMKARRSNSESGITSILYYYRGKYIHFAEGSEQSITKLIDDVCSDERHADVEVIYDSALRRRYVEGSPLKLASANGDIHRGFAEFLFGVLNLNHLDIGNNAELLEVLVSLSAESIGSSPDEGTKSNDTVMPVTSDSDFDQCVLGVSKWPNFTQEDVNSGLLQLCALLMSKQVPYHLLLAENPFPGVQELDTALRRLQDMSLLSMTYNNNIQKEEKPPKKGFFSKMQKFIKRLQQ